MKIIEQQCSSGKMVADDFTEDSDSDTDSESSKDSDDITERKISKNAANKKKKRSVDIHNVDSSKYATRLRRFEINQEVLVNKPISQKYKRGTTQLITDDICNINNVKFYYENKCVSKRQI